MRLPLVLLLATLLLPLAAAGPASDAAAGLYGASCADRTTAIACDQMRGDLGTSTFRFCREGSPQPTNPVNYVHDVGQLASSVTEFAIGVDFCRGGLGAFANGTAAWADAVLP